MKIVIFGGTTEGRMLSHALADAGAEVIVSVVSEYGATIQGDHSLVSVATGLRDKDEMIELIDGADVVVDATHPYAAEATINIRRASDSAGVSLIRLKRQGGNKQTGSKNSTSGIIWAADPEDAIGKATSRADSAKGNIMLTTGVKDLSFYCENLDKDRIFARVLPSKESIELCIKAGLAPSNIIAIQGPFSTAMNQALIREYDIAVMITKESGKTGGFDEKIRACKSCGIPAVVITRPEEKGYTYDEVLNMCLTMLKG